MNGRNWKFTILAATLVAISCGPPEDPYPDQPRNRRMEAAPAAAHTIRGGPADSILLKPGSLLDVRDGHIAVFDYGRGAVEAFDSTGTLQWIVGKTGDGPGEFREPTSMSIDDSGRTWVQDRSTLTITAIDAAGRLGAPLRHPKPEDDDQPDRFVALEGDRYALLSQQKDKLTYWDRTRPSSETRAHPWRGLGKHDWMTRTSYLVRGPGANLTYVFMMGGGFQTAAIGEFFDDLVPFVERIPIPETTSKTGKDGDDNVTLTTMNATYRAAVDASISGTTLYVLFEGATEDGRRLVDRYELPAGQYLGSWLLPEPAFALAADGDLMVTLEGELIPKLVIRRIPSPGSD